jgi:G3E family GTPase
MAPRTPLTVITGALGSGKTTLLRHLLAASSEKLAILINEFGEIAIDTKVVAGKNVQIAELEGGCVCCSLTGEFEAAVKEISQAVQPDRLVVETTGIAEPDALVLDIEENLDQVRLDGVVTVCDADAMVRFPQLGRTARIQIAAADLILLNKIDLVSEAEADRLEELLARENPRAETVRTRYARVDPELLFGISPATREVSPIAHPHVPEFDSFSYRSDAAFEKGRFVAFADRLGGSRIYRAKGFVRFTEGAELFNFVAGRWDLEPFPRPETALVFIGKNARAERDRIVRELEECIA